MKKPKNETNHEEARELRHNKGLTIEELASRYGKSKRTIYRWLNSNYQEKSPVQHKIKKKYKRARKYPPEIFNRILNLKIELPQRSAPVKWRSLQKEFPNNTPSLSTIRKYIRDEGFTYKSKDPKRGYVKFERKQPNDLWQIDIAGVQTVGHLEKLYLIALLDDYSRFIVAAEYFKNQK